ncbi:hypothetical protein BDP55DRAFT_656744 [Colletotrichum godetiae]|uniref:Uncharacterized protein n=1 Tax=Colletotrichum godetiae TaxID=1209918 RepID=A0AAJ0AS11_9PEZI|nr:uncharacterized protein BDP55DRAFT_656744 [Colletotrichum godetiae]KAK1688673.1 hypothetical protein BDP55DRAFT_656744 [Colletotrichum godetiae]
MSELTGSDPAMASTPESAANTTQQTTCKSTITSPKLEDVNTALLSQRNTDIPQTQGSDFTNIPEAILTSEPGINKSEPDGDMIHPEVLATMQSVFKEEVRAHMSESAASLESVTDLTPEAIAKYLAVHTRDMALVSMEDFSPACSPPTTIIRSCAQEPEELRFFKAEAHDYTSPMERQMRVHTSDLGEITRQMISFATNMSQQAGPSHRPSVRFEKIYSLQPYQPTEHFTGEAYPLTHNMLLLGATLPSEFSWQSDCKRSRVTVNTQTGVWIFIEYRGIHGDYSIWMDREVEKGWKLGPLSVHLRI